MLDSQWSKQAQGDGMRASEVFTPGAFPTHTYVERHGLRLEKTLEQALETKGHLVSLSGPSKSGKTVLVERVVGLPSLTIITGSRIKQADDLWNRVLDTLGVPASESISSETSTKGS